MRKNISPRRLMSFTLLLWLFLEVISPLDYTVSIKYSAILLLIFYITSFYLGTFFYDLIIQTNNINKSKDPLLNHSSIKKTLIIVMFLGISGLLLRFFDLIFLKSFLSYGSITEFRLNYNSNNMDLGIISIISAVLFPFSISSFIFAFYHKEFISRITYLINLFMLTGSITYFILLGGRTTITLLIVMLMLAGVLKYPQKKFIVKEFFNKNIKYISVGIIFFLYSQFILLNRLNSMGFTIESHLKYMEIERHFKVNDWLFWLVENNSFLGSLAYTFVSLLHYFLHGFYQFFLLFNYFDMENITWGAMQYFPIIKFFGFIGYDTISGYELNSIVETQGVYTTFFGPVFVDFGFWGFLYMFIMGFVIQYFFKKSIKGNEFHKLIYPYWGAVILHASFLNMIQSGMGLYILISLSLTAMIYGFFKKVRRI